MSHRRDLMIALACALWIPATTLASTPPICDPGGPYYGLEGDAVTFDGTGSTDPDGTIVDYAWDFGDGNVANGGQVTHTYAVGGVYLVVLVVTDDAGDRSQCETTIDVEVEIPDLPRPMTLDGYLMQVDAALPPIPPGMTNVPDGEDWFSDMTVDQVAETMDDVPPSTVIFDGPVWIGHDEPDSMSARYVKLDFSRDYLRFINQDRAFQWESPHMAVDETEALALFEPAVEALGLPGEEMGDPRVDTILGTEVAEGSTNESTVEVERLITMPRQVGGYPVIGSMARMAISNEGEITRALVKWPRFALVPDPQLLNRDDVVDEIANRIWEAEEGVEVQLDISLGYARTTDGYVPVAKVGFSDLEGVMEGGALELVPLVATTVSTDGPDLPAARFSLRARVMAGGRVQIAFELPVAQRAAVSVFDVGGRRVHTIAASRLTAGRHALEWDGSGAGGSRVASGVYFVRLEAEQGELMQKIVLTR